jgi:hypothetical protein
MQPLFYLTLIAFIAMLYVWSQDPETDAAAARAMRLALVSLGAGIATNILCTAVGYATVAGNPEPTKPKPTLQQIPGAPPPAAPEPWTLSGLSDACLPYSIVAVALGARIYTFDAPLTLEERLYIQDTPSRTGRFALEMLKSLGRGVDFVFRKMSLVKPDGEPVLTRKNTGAKEL